MAERPPPSALAVAFASALIAGLAGYFLGQASAIGVFSNKPAQAGVIPTGGAGAAASRGKGKGKGAEAKAEDDSDISDAESASDSDDDDDDVDDLDDQELKGFEDSNEECKLVLVVRTDLGMTKGKIAAQCGHATLACYKTLLRQDSPVLKRWERYGQAKVALQVKSEEELETLQATALSLGICAQIIHDAGRTQIASGSATVLGVGPAPKSQVDAVTGHLKLL